MGARYGFGWTHFSNREVIIVEDDLIPEEEEGQQRWRDEIP
jgi:hypothetical protein